jgi:hypothetical protein
MAYTSHVSIAPPKWRALIELTSDVIEGRKIMLEVALHP